VERSFSIADLKTARYAAAFSSETRSGIPAALSARTLMRSDIDLRTGNYLYIDKTKQMLRLIERGQTLFLSRPRRFSKSLLVSTLQALFEGRKDLFDGRYEAFYASEIDALRFVCSAWLVPKLKLYQLKKLPVEKSRIIKVAPLQTS
jgi:hypothetical protein